MTEGVGSGELNVMTDFDFKTPINATVIYYDSDEDVKPLIEKKKNSNDMDENIDIDAIVSEIFEDIFKASNKSNDENQVSTSKRKQSSERKNKNKIKKAEQNRKIENYAELEYQNKAEILGENHAANIRNKTIYRKNQSESSVQGRVLQSTSDTEIVTDALQCPNNIQIETNILQSPNNMEIITNPLHTENANRNLKTNTVQEIDENHSLVSITKTAFPQNPDTINTQVDECLKTLLNTVSTHMIFIMKAYTDYETVARRTSDKKLMEIAKKKYQDTKSHFFYLSFSAVANIMLPKENEYNFMENFIDNTVKMAKSKHFYFKHTDMRLLCNEMFGWVKSHSQYSILSELLNKTPQQRPHTSTPRNTNSYHERKGCDKTNNVDKTCIFRSGPHNRELVISLNPTVVQNSIQQFNDVNLPLHTIQPSMQVAQPPSSNTNLQSYTNPPSYIMPPSNTNLPIYEKPPSYLNPPSNTNLSNYVNHENQPSYANQPSYINQPSCVNPPSNTNIPGYIQEFQSFNSRQDYNRQFPIHQPKSKKRQTNTHHHNPTSQDKTLRPPLWRSETLFPQNEISPAHCEGFLPDQGQTEIGQNRSLSRDSGFMSPLSSVPNDNMCNSPRNGQIDSSTLVITHVTSLNPSVAYIKDGTCHVCNKLTKQICLGCYKTYYCSNQCQRDDWRNHFLYCKL